MGDEKKKEVKGKAALPRSDRREFRRFRPRVPKEGQPSTTQTSESSNAQKEGEGGGKTKKSRPRPCRYFNTENGCRLEEKCPFRHILRPVKGTATEAEEKGETPNEGGKEVHEVVLPPQVHRGEPLASRAIVVPRVVTLTAEQAGSEEQTKQLDSEINYFKRRFRGTKLTTDGEEKVVVFDYAITDPEWPFDIRNVVFSLFLLPHHPIAPPWIQVVHGSNPSLPDVLTRHVAVALNKEIERRHSESSTRNAHSTYGKWLIHRIDRMILDLFVDGLRRTKLVFDAEQAGISLVVPSRNKEEKKEKEEPPGIDELTNEVKEVSIEEEELSESDEEEEETPCEGQTTEDREEKTKEKPTIQVVLTWTNTSGSVATLQAESLRLLLRCSRCPEVREASVPVSGSKTGARCPKCAQAQSVTAFSSLVHAASSTISLLHCVGCKPVDLILLHSRLRFVCMGCMKEDPMQSISFGAVHKSWCHGCHSLIEFSILNSRFLGTHESGEDRETAQSVPKPRKPKEIRETGGGMVVGHPLPDMGTCKHYRKSYRWFRFPCCGRVFPCDTCHEESVKGEHEMKLANRMVCGYCSYEQPFTMSKPCAKCNESTTRKKSQFWEGGKGCRDQKAMSKNDVHKFAGSRGKTVSKKKVPDLIVKGKNS